jgi:hypothetical protein
VKSIVYELLKPGIGAQGKVLAIHGQLYCSSTHGVNDLQFVGLHCAAASPA